MDILKLYWIIRNISFFFNFFLYFSECAVPKGCNGNANADIIFVVDSSESVTENDPYGERYFYWNNTKKFLTHVTQTFEYGNENTNVGIFQFSDIIDRNILHLRDGISESDVQNHIYRMDHQGRNTRTSEALLFADSSFSFKNGDRDNHRNILVVITDGLSNIELDYVESYANRVKTRNIEIYVVSIHKWIDEHELNLISSDPNDKHLIKMEDHHLVEHYANVLLHRICGLADPKVPEIKKEEHVKRPRKKPIYKPPRTPECNFVTDLALLIDNSGSIRDDHPDNYLALKNFLVSLVGDLNVALDKTRVGAARFSDDVVLEFYLNQYNELGVKEKIINMDFDGSHTNMAGALAMAKEVIFKESNGDRKDVLNTVLLITDGYGTINDKDTMPLANALKESGAVVFVVGVGNGINVTNLQAIASTPVKYHYFGTTDIKYLPSLKNTLIEHVCSNTIGSLRKKRSINEWKFWESSDNAGLHVGSFKHLTGQNHSIMIIVGLLSLALLATLALMVHIVYQIRNEQSKNAAYL